MGSRGNAPWGFRVVHRRRHDVKASVGVDDVGFVHPLRDGGVEGFLLLGGQQLRAQGFLQVSIQLHRAGRHVTDILEDMHAIAADNRFADVTNLLHRERARGERRIPVGGVHMHG